MSADARMLRPPGFSGCRTVKRFPSRRNEVCLVTARRPDGSEMEFVYKKFLSGDVERECAALSALSGARVPAVLAKDGCSLWLEYIPGDTLLERLEEAERLEASFCDSVDGLLDFLHAFYARMPGRIYGDVNLRNFIAAPGGVYGVDLEEVREGDPEVDIGRIAAFLLTYAPAWTPLKKHAADHLIRRAAERLALDRSEIERQKQNELAAMRLRRGGNP